MIAPIGTQNIERPVRAAAVSSPAAAPLDAFVRVPESMSAHDLREITEANMRALRGAPQQKVDPKKIPFGVELEMEGFNQQQATPFINNMPGWNVHPTLTRWKMTSDQSLSSGTGGEAVSPPMTLENGEAAKQIAAVLNHLSSLGGQMTRNCGLHIHIDTKCLGEKGLMNLMAMVLENEHTLYRLSQNGYKNHRGTLPGHGYRHNRMYHYCMPLGHALTDPFALLHTQTPNEFRNTLYGAIPADANHPRPPLPAVNSTEKWKPDHKDSVRYFGINFNAYWYQGTVEFRLFEASADPAQVMENVEMVLGMVAAAANGDYAYMHANPLGGGTSNENLQQNPPVSKETFEYLLSKVAHTPAHKDRLRQTFIKSGGILKEDTPVNDPFVVRSAFLLQQGYQFSVDNKDVHSPFEIGALLNGRKPVTWRSPDKAMPESAVLKDISDLYSLCDRVERSINQQRVANLAPADHALLENVTALMDKGFVLSTDGGAQLHKATLSMLDAVLPAAARLQVRFPGCQQAWPVDGRAALETLSNAALGQDDRVGEGARARLAAADVLLAKGYRFFSPDGKEEMKSRAAAVLSTAVPPKLLSVGSMYAIAATDMGLRNLMHFESAHMDKMDVPIRAAVERATALQSSGFKLEERAERSADLIALLASDTPVSWTDPMGRKYTANDANAFVDQADKHLKMVGVPDEQRAALTELQSMAKAGRIVVSTQDGQRIDVASVQPAWLLNNQAGLLIHGSPEVAAADATSKGANQNWAVPIKQWGGVTDFVTAETQPPTSANVLRLIDGMRKAGTQFFYVAPPGEGQKRVRTPVTLNSAAQVQMNGASGVRVTLPGRIFWKCLFRKHITVKNEETLARIAHKLGVDVAPAPVEAPAAAADVAVPAAAVAGAPALTAPAAEQPPVKSRWATLTSWFGA